LRRPWLLPLVPAYALVSALRWWGVRPKRLGCPVVSVGNLSTGGTGKTPFVIALAGLLKREGVAVDVLSRGYGRRLQGAAWVRADGNAEVYGDEPLLITREAQVMVYVAARRFEAGGLAEGLGNEPVLHLLDDGFQHRQLARAVDIVLVNSEDLGDCLLPAGNLRESPSALRRASVFAVESGDDAAVARLRALGLTQPVWRFRREMAVPEVAVPVVAFCGIARPEQFFAGLEAAGVAIVGRRAFGDHHRFTEGDLQSLERMADRGGAGAVLTTEKDRVRIGDLAVHLGQAPLLTVGLRVVLEDETDISNWLKVRLESERFGSDLWNRDRK
jgi:tetraacyldisaccharide 4'-kinase